MLIKDGANPKEVMVEMGHSNIAMTYDLYGHLFTDEDADTRRAERAERLAGKLPGAKASLPGSLLLVFDVFHHPLGAGIFELSLRDIPAPIFVDLSEVDYEWRGG
jgi:hypothetical protein